MLVSIKESNKARKGDTECWGEGLQFSTGWPGQVSLGMGAGRVPILGQVRGD